MIEDYISNTELAFKAVNILNLVAENEICDTYCNISDETNYQEDEIILAINFTQKLLIEYLSRIRKEYYDKMVAEKYS